MAVVDAKKKSYVSKFVFSFNNPHHPRYWVRVLFSEVLEVVMLVISLVTQAGGNDVATGILWAALALQTSQLPFLAMMARHYHVAEKGAYRQFVKFLRDDEGEISESSGKELVETYVDPHTNSKGWVVIKRKKRNKSMASSIASMFFPVDAVSSFLSKVSGAASKSESVDKHTSLRFEDFEFPHRRPTKRTTLVHISEFVADWLTFSASLLLFEVGKRQAVSTWIQGFLAIFNIVLLTRSILSSYLDAYDTPFTPLKVFLLSALMFTYVGFFALLIGVFSALSVLYEKEVFVREGSANLSPEVRTGLIYIGALSGLAVGIGVCWYATFSCLVCFKCLWRKKERSLKEQAQFAAIAAAGGNFSEIATVGAAVSAVAGVDSVMRGVVKEDDTVAKVLKGVDMVRKATAKK